MTDTHATRLRRICRRLPQLLGRATRLMLALMLVPSLAWGQTMDEMKRMLQQFLDQNKALQQRIEKLEIELAPPPAAPAGAPSPAPPQAPEANKPEAPATTPPTAGERLS
ncbi:MAG: hypothetical protein HYY88_11540, partial [candidate division NC10 bacterium]|nr:hypothetical protein [candidate division NC10 bacterium]